MTPLEFPHAGFPGVAPDHVAEPLIGDLELLFREARLGAPPGNEILPGDGLFLHVAVTGQFQYLHAVEQRPGNAFQGVGGGDEQHLGKVVGEVQVVVAELPVLFRIQNLHQCGGRVAPEVAPELVDLVEHQNGVGDAGPAHTLENAARHGADIGAAVTAQFGFIVQAAEAHALELPAHRTGDGLPQRGLADARRPDEAEYRRVGVRIQLHHGQGFENALLDVFEPVMVFVEYHAGVFEVELILGLLAPGQFGDEFQVPPGHLVVGGVGGHAAQALQLAVHLGLDVGR